MGILPRVASSPSRGGCAPRHRAEWVKLFATAVLALERAGASSPGDRLALIHGWNTATLLVKKGAFESGEIAAIRAFTEARSLRCRLVSGHAGIRGQPLQSSV